MLNEPRLLASKASRSVPTTCGPCLWYLHVSYSNPLSSWYSVYFAYWYLCALCDGTQEHPSSVGARTPETPPSEASATLIQHLGCGFCPELVFLRRRCVARGLQYVPSVSENLVCVQLLCFLSRRRNYHERRVFGCVCDRRCFFAPGSWAKIP